jgi:hypothetical protein
MMIFNIFSGSSTGGVNRSHQFRFGVGAFGLTPEWFVLGWQRLEL